MIAVVGPPITREAAQEAARRELSKAIYHRYDDPLLIRILRWIGRLLDRITHDITRYAPGGAAGAIAIVALLVGLALLARWRLGPVQRTMRRADELRLRPALRADDYRQEAMRHAHKGDWTLAVIARMRAIARELEQRGLVEPLPGRTADELAREATREAPAFAESLARAVRVFDDVVYGEREAGPSSYEALVTADEAVQRRRTLTHA